MRTILTRFWALVIGLLFAMSPGVRAPAASVISANAPSGYFVNAFAGSPLASYLFGDVNKSTTATAVSGTDYTDGTSVFSSNGYSSVDLSTGSLHSLASANFGYYPGALPNLTSSFQFGNSSFGDSLTFLGDFTGQLATFHISIDGTWSGSTSFNGSDFQFMVLPAGTINANAGNTLNFFNNPGNVAIVNDNYSLTSTTNNPLTFDINVDLHGHNPTIEFASNLNIVTSTDLGQSFSADYSNTAKISLKAPNGVIVESRSGVFPGTVPVPEPGSLLLAIVGLVGAGLFSRVRFTSPSRYTKA